MSKTIVLRHPIQVGKEGELITKLTFREEVVAGDMRGIPARDPPMYEDILKLAGRLCGQPDVVMNQIRMDDFGEVATLVGLFTEDGQSTGPTP